MGGWWLCWQGSSIDGYVGDVAVWTFTECGIYYLQSIYCESTLPISVFIHLRLLQGTRPITSALPPSPTYHSRLLELYEVLRAPRFNHACTSTTQPTPPRISVMSSRAPANRDDQIAQLAGLTGVPPAEASSSKLLETITVKQHADCLQAERYLDAANGDLQVAAELFYEQSAEADQPSDTEMAGDDEPTNPPPEQQPVPGGGRTLGGAYVPPTEASSSSSSRAQSTQPKAPQQRGVAGLRTLKDLQSGGGGHGHAHDDDDSDDDKDDENQDFFAGGEKSGLAVQNPNQANPRNHINDILKRARQ